MFKILVVEDDKNARKLIEAALKHEKYNVLTAGDGQAALDILDKEHVDLITLDVMMPKMNGYELTRELRRVNFNIPILMITAKQLLKDKREGFLAGTDDYLTKPFDNEEMLLRVGALLRRAESVNKKKLIIGKVTLDYESYTVEREEKVKSIPKKEFLLLFKLLSSPGKIFTRIEIMDEIWGLDSESSYKTVNAHINNLRRRFEEYTEFSLVAVRGLGYKAVIHEK